MTKNWHESAPNEDQMRETFERWLSDGTSWIGIFENKALDSAAIGERVALVFDMSDWNDAHIDASRMPDTKSRIGWKYILVSKCRTVDEALGSMQRGEQHGARPRGAIVPLKRSGERPSSDFNQTERAQEARLDGIHNGDYDR